MQNYKRCPSCRGAGEREYNLYAQSLILSKEPHRWVEPERTESKRVLAQCHLCSGAGWLLTEPGSEGPAEGEDLTRSFAEASTLQGLQSRLEDMKKRAYAAEEEVRQIRLIAKDLDERAEAAVTPGTQKHMMANVKERLLRTLSADVAGNTEVTLTMDMRYWRALGRQLGLLSSA